MSFPYKHVLIIGATSGIGRAMADHFIAQGLKVTAVGRREKRLKDFVEQHGSDKASSLTFDIEKLDEIPNFINQAFANHPTIDSVMLNAGTQSRSDFSKPETVDLSAFHREMTINFTSFVSLVHAILPHLLPRSSPTNLIFTGTQISLVPTFPMPAYSASKAALDAFIVCLREQLHNSHVTVQHISPGPVRTEFHPEFGMFMEGFVEEAWAGLVSNTTDIFPGTVGGSTKEQFLELVRMRDEAVGRMSAVLRQFAV